MLHIYIYIFIVRIDIYVYIARHEKMPKSVSSKVVRRYGPKIPSRCPSILAIAEIQYPCIHAT